MKNVLNDFASPGLTSHRRPGRPLLWRRMGAYALAVGSVLATAGCSAIGSMPDLWPFGGSDAPITADSFDNPDQIAEAIKDARGQMQLAPGEPYWPYHLGELYAAADSTVKATLHLQNAMALDPSYAPAAGLLGKLYYDTGSFELGVVLLEDFIANNPGAPDELHAALALHLEAIGDVEAAEAALARCSSDSKSVQTTRTFVSLRGATMAGAYEVAKKAVDNDAKDAANHNNYGIALLGQGRPVEARKAFMTALDIDKHLAGAMYNMAIVETFYFFNEVAGKQWFERYQQHAAADPDDLAAVFGVAPTAGMSAGAVE